VKTSDVISFKVDFSKAYQKIDDFGVNINSKYWGGGALKSILNSKVHRSSESMAEDPHQSEMVELMIHEQQFHRSRPEYQPDYEEKVVEAVKRL